MNLDLNLLITFEKLIRTKSVTRTAEELGLTQSAVSLALSRLRSSLNDPLFVKTSQGMLPTPFAEEIQVPIQQALQQIQGVLDKGTVFQPQTSDKTIQLVLLDSCAFVVLPKLMSLLSQEAPAMKVNLVKLQEKEIDAAMETGSVDLAIGLYPNLKVGFYQQILYKEGLVSILRKGHPLGGQKNLSLENFLKLGHIQVATGSGNLGLLDTELKKRQLTRSIVMQIPNFALAPMIVEDTDFVASLPEKIALRSARSLDLKVFACPLPMPPYEIKQYWHERNQNDPFNQWLRNKLFAMRDLY